MRINWRNDATKNDAVRFTDCTSCGVDAGKVCRTQMGEIAAAIHAPRYDAARAKVSKTGP